MSGNLNARYDAIIVGAFFYGDLVAGKYDLMNDLMSAGIFGLMDAIEAFDLDLEALALGPSAVQVLRL